MSRIQQHDHEQLPHQLLAVGKRITKSARGGLVLAEPNSDGTLRLYVAGVESDTIDSVEIRGLTSAVDDTSIIGHAARTKKVVVVPDAYDLPADASFIMDPSFDERHRYRRRSMLIVPMVDHHDHLVGVLVFVN